jgi:hypothetical protein
VFVAWFGFIYKEFSHPKKNTVVWYCSFKPTLLIFVLPVLPLQSSKGVLVMKMSLVQGIAPRRNSTTINIGVLMEPIGHECVNNVTYTMGFLVQWA